MAISDLEAVGRRLKELRKRAGNPSQYEAAYEMGFKPRTFQSWENGEWETDRRNYDRIAEWYSERLDTPITSTWILFGQDEEPRCRWATPSPSSLPRIDYRD